MNKIDYLENSELLLEQWKNQANLRGIVDAFMVQGNKVQDALFEIRDLMYLDIAVGEGLDFIGKIFNVVRGALNDDDYRMEIKKKASTRYSGEPEAVIAILRSIFGASYVQYSPEYPGKYRVRTDAAITTDELQVFSPAGVQGFLAGYIVDALGNHIVSAVGDHLIHTSPGAREILLDGSGDPLLDGSGNPIETVGFYE